MACRRVGWLEAAGGRSAAARGARGARWVDIERRRVVVAHCADQSPSSHRPRYEFSHFRPSSSLVGRVSPLSPPDVHRCFAFFSVPFSR